MAYSRYGTHGRGHSSAVASVLFSRGSDTCDTTKSGSYIYDGSPSNYHEWEFRTRLRVRAAGTKDEEKYAEAMSNVVDGLRGDACIVAKECGLSRLWYVGDTSLDSLDNDPAKPGVAVLIDAIKKEVFPQTTHEANEMFR